MKNVLKIRKTALICLLIATLCFLTFGFISTRSVNAEVNTKTVNQVEFVMDKGAGIRVASDSTINGIRFLATMSEEDYTALMNNVGEGKAYKSVSFGMIIAPENYVSYEGKGLTVENLFGDNAIYDWAVNGEYSGNKVRIINLPSSSMQIEEGVGYAGGSIIDLKDGTDGSVNNIPRAFVGRGYIKYVNQDDTVGYVMADYYDDDIKNNTRSMAYLAQCAIVDGKDVTALNTAYLSKITNEQAVSSIINISDFETANYLFPSLYSGKLPVTYVSGAGIKIDHSSADTEKIGVEFSSALLKAAANKGYDYVEINMERDAAFDPWVNVDGKNYRGQTGAKNFYAGNLEFGSNGGTTVTVPLSDCLTNGEYKLYLNLYGGYFVITSVKFIAEEEPEIIISKDVNYASKENKSLYTGSVYYLDGLGLQCRNEVEFDSNTLKAAAEQGYKALVLNIGRDGESIDPWVNVDGKDHRGGSNAKNIFVGNLGVISEGGTTVTVNLDDCLFNGEYKLYFNTYSDYYIITSAKFVVNPISSTTNYASKENKSLYTGSVYYLDGLGLQCRNEVEFDSNTLKAAAEQGYKALVLNIGRDGTSINPWVNVDGKDHRGGSNAKNIFVGNLGVISEGGTTVTVNLDDCLFNGEYKLYFNTYSDYYIITSAEFSK